MRRSGLLLLLERESMHRLDDDCLLDIVKRLPQGDWLPTGLACKSLDRAWRAAATEVKEFEVATDPVASISRAKWAIEMEDGVPEEWCDLAAAKGDVEVLTWLRLVGARWTERTVLAAAKRGIVEMLEFLLEHRCPCNLESSFREAILKGHLQAAKCLRAHGASPTKADSLASIRHANIELLDWMHSIGADFGYEEMDDALGKVGSAAVVRWLVELGHELPFEATYVAAVYGRTSVLRYLHSLNVERDKGDLRQAVYSEEAGAVEFLLSVGTPLDNDIMSEAANVRDTEAYVAITKLLVAHGAKFTPASVTTAANSGQLEVVRLAHNARVWDARATVEAVGSGSVEVVDFLIREQAPFETTTLETVAYVEDDEAYVAITRLLHAKGIAFTPRSVEMAARRGKAEVVKLVPKAMWEKKHLIAAVKGGRREVAKIIIDEAEWVDAKLKDVPAAIAINMIGGLYGGFR